MNIHSFSIWQNNKKGKKTIERLPPQNHSFSLSTPWAIVKYTYIYIYIYIYILFEENVMFLFLEIFMVLCFCEIHKFKNLWRRHRHWSIMEVTLLVISFESYAIGKQHLVRWFIFWETILRCFFSSEDWNLVPGPFMVLIKWEYNKIC